MQRRKDGRLANQLRPMSAEMGLLKEADGSARMNVGTLIKLKKKLYFAFFEYPREIFVSLYTNPSNSTLFLIIRILFFSSFPWLYRL